jgi:protein TonB
MFEQTFVQTQQARRPWTVAVSLSLQCGVVAVLLLIPLLHPETLRFPDPPKPHLIRTWITQPPIPIQKTALRVAQAPAITYSRPVFVAPGIHASESRHIDVPVSDTAVAAWTGPSLPGLLPSLTAGTPLPPRAGVPVPATPVAKVAAAGPLKVGGGVQAARLLFGPHPSYPQLAKAARAQGVVKLEAIIAADGSVRNLRLASGPLLLATAAIDAVRQWRYQPTLLNGVAVEVVTEIEVNFTLTN